MARTLRHAAFGVFGIADWTWSSLSNVSGLTYASNLPVNCLQQFPSYTPSCVIPRCLWCWCDRLGQRLQNKQHHGTRPSSQQFHGIQRLAVQGCLYVCMCVCNFSTEVKPVLPWMMVYKWKNGLFLFYFYSVKILHMKHTSCRFFSNNKQGGKASSDDLA